MKFPHLRHTWEFVSEADGKQGRRCTKCGKFKVGTKYGGRLRSMDSTGPDTW